MQRYKIRAKNLCDKHRFFCRIYFEFRFFIATFAAKIRN